jgi:potassium/hydrogen antiporter
MPVIEPYLVAAAILVLAGVAVSKVAARSGIPAVLLFLVIGMLAGSDGIGGIEFDDHQLARSVGVIALTFILFDGGLSTSWRRVRPALPSGLALASLGVVITAGVTGLAATWVLDVPVEIGLLLGAIVSSTDAAAVFSVLRSRGAGLGGGTQPILELESGTNDPMAVFLTIALIEVAGPDGAGPGELMLLFLQQLAIGAVIGLVVAWVAQQLVNRSNLEYDGLYPVASLSIALLTYGAATSLGGSGFLAVYLAGIRLGNTDLLHRASLRRFHDALAWLSQIAMFLVLGLLVFPSRLPEVAGSALLVSAVLILVARPLAVGASLALSRMPVRERAMVAWVGLRGAVPIVLATFPLGEELPEAQLVFDVVFFVVLTSVLVQGTTLPVVSRLLGVSESRRPRPPYPFEPAGSLPDGTSLHEIDVPADAPIAGRRLVDLGLPERALVVLITRDDRFVLPQGRTAVEAGDVLLVLSDAATARRVAELVAGDDTG